MSLFSCQIVSDRSTILFQHLASTYGGRAWEVAELTRPTGKQWPRCGIPLATHYPYIEAEVRFACKEYACTIEDILSRRTRLAFLNSEAALQALPRVADIMAEELGWSRKIKARQIQEAKDYLESYGGRIPVEDDLTIRLPTLQEAMDIFKEVDRSGSGFLDMEEIKEMAIRLGQPLPEKEVKRIFQNMDKDGDGKVTPDEFTEWFEKAETKEAIRTYFNRKTLQIFDEIDRDRSGHIDEQELADITLRLGRKMGQSEIKKVFKLMDKDGDGKVSFRRNCAVLCVPSQRVLFNLSDLL